MHVLIIKKVRIKKAVRNLCSIGNPFGLSWILDQYLIFMLSVFDSVYTYSFRNPRFCFKLHNMISLKYVLSVQADGIRRICKHVQIALHILPSFSITELTHSFINRCAIARRNAVLNTYMLRLLENLFSE